MDVSRRRFLVHLGQFVALGGTGLVAACQSNPPPVTVTSAPAAATTAPTTKPAIAPVASVSPATAAAASPVAGASPSAKPAASPGVAAAASPSPVAAGAVAGKPMYQMDAQHTGRSPHAGPRRLNLLRSFDTASRKSPDTLLPIPDIQSSMAIGPDNTIYPTTFAGELWALKDSSTPQQLDLVWRYHPAGGSPFHATAALSRDAQTVYVPFTTGAGPATKGTLYAVKAPPSGQDGQLVWQAELGAGPVRNTPTRGDDGTIYIVNFNGQLSAVDGSNGNVKWTATIGTGGTPQFGQTIKVAPALGSDGTVYIAAVTGSLYAVTPPTGGGAQGSVKWSFDFGQHLGSKPLLAQPVTGLGNSGQDAIGSAASATIGPDGTIYIGADNSNFYAIDPNGQQKWIFEADRELAGIWTTACLSSDNSTLFFGANGGGVYAVNARDGSKKWQYPVYGSIYASPALDSRGTLYVATTSGQVLALDSSNGSAISVYEAVEAVWSAPSIRPNGTIVVGDRTGKILVLGES